MDRSAWGRAPIRTTWQGRIIVLFNSYAFLIFFPIVLLVYYIVPRRARYLWLLAASYYFYMCWNAKYALLLLFSTVVTYLSGLALERFRVKGRGEGALRAVVAVSFVLNLGILAVFKYAGFAMDIVHRLAGWVGVDFVVPEFDILLPVGISFYTFQALSYTMDVYRGEIYAERNFFRYALFVSFFPQLVAGPIERSKNLLKQLAEPKPFSFERARDGFMLMLWGYFLKLVLADRIALFVDKVYNDLAAFPGFYGIFATLLFAFQIYCDFMGYSTIAMGAARILGVELMENFDAPYLSCSVADFWRRWHISLTSWFRDYLYIPLGGSRKGKARKQLNRMVVFLTSGLWHGADIKFVLWGGLNGLYQVVGDALRPLRDRLVTRLGINRESRVHRLLCGAFTFALVDFAWIFFRANTVGDGLQLIRSALTVWNPGIIKGALFEQVMDGYNCAVLALGLGVLLGADVCKRRGIVVRRELLKRRAWIRLPVIALIILVILTFGVWGPAYDSASFIYFQF